MTNQKKPIHYQESGQVHVPVAFFYPWIILVEAEKNISFFHLFRGGIRLTL
jgi:hypothetical protein